MHGFIHRACGSGWVNTDFRRDAKHRYRFGHWFAGGAARSTPFRCPGRRPGRSLKFFLKVRQRHRSRVRQRSSAVVEAGFFFRLRPVLKTRRQVYNQKLVYRIMVIVNDPLPLWINPVLSTRSGVYVPHKPVGRLCMCLVEKLDKIWRRGKKPRSSQSIPVDMQTLIHSG